MTVPNTSSATVPPTRALKRVQPKASQESADRATDPAGSPAISVTKADITRDDLTGYCLGRYALGPKIGSGGMGKVFTARHLHLNRNFAIKFLSSDLTESTDAQLRFEQEVLTLGVLHHPNIVNAVDAGCINGLKYLVTELVEGEDLAKLVQRRGRLPVAEACEFVRQAAVGLAYSHEHGFVHRDIKPSNLILDRDGSVIVLDFGLVRSLQVDAHLTENGEMLGTWDFLAPEQAHNASDVDSRCDLYSLGCTLVYLLSGSVPFGGPHYATPAAKLKGHLFDRPPWLNQLPAQIPGELATVIELLLAKSPTNRFASADEAARALLPFTSSIPLAKTTNQLSRDRSVSWVPPGIVIALSLVICCGFLLFRESPSEARSTAPRHEVFNPPPLPDTVSDESESMIDADETSAVAVESPAIKITQRRTLEPQQARNAMVELNLPLGSTGIRLQPKAAGR